MIQTLSGKENVLRSGMTKTDLGSKRGFVLRHEIEEVTEEASTGKWFKAESKICQLTEIQAEVASEKWPQLDQ